MDTDPISKHPPKIIANRELNNDTVHVTFALPGLRRATVSVPRDRWTEGGHIAVGAKLAELVAELDLQDDRLSSRIPE